MQGMDKPQSAAGAAIDISGARLSANKIMDMAKQGEAIMDALELAVNNDATNPLFCGATPSDYVLQKLDALELSTIERVLLLLLLPAPELRSLLSFTTQWIQHEKKLELGLRILYAIIHIQAFSLSVADDEMVTLLHAARDAARAKTSAKCIVIGMNAAALNMMKKDLEMTNNIKFYSELPDKVFGLRHGTSVKAQKKKTKNVQKDAV